MARVQGVGLGLQVGRKSLSGGEEGRTAGGLL
jgi:hypothetical protein